MVVVEKRVVVQVAVVKVVDVGNREGDADGLIAEFADELNLFLAWLVVDLKRGTGKLLETLLTANFGGMAERKNTLNGLLSMNSLMLNGTLSSSSTISISKANSDSSLSASSSSTTAPPQRQKKW